jgi:hypothetical protein
VTLQGTVNEPLVGEALHANGPVKVTSCAFAVRQSIKNNTLNKT